MIKLSEIVKEINANILTKEQDVSDIEVSDAYVSDLLSDVMGNAKDNQLWITIMKHLNTVAVASLANIPCIIYSKGLVPDQEVIDKANEVNVCLLTTPLSTFRTAGKIYQMLQI